MAVKPPMCMDDVLTELQTTFPGKNWEEEDTDLQQGLLIAEAMRLEANGELALTICEMYQWRLKHMPDFNIILPKYSNIKVMVCAQGGVWRDSVGSQRTDPST